MATVSNSWAVRARRHFHKILSFLQKERSLPSATDLLTGLDSCARLLDVLERQFVQVGAGKPLTLIVLDLDKLCALNGDYGPGTGDAALQVVAIALQSIARWQDVTARFHDGEMVLAMPDTSLAVGQRIAHTIRRAVEAKTIACGGTCVKVTVSAGVATAEPGGPFQTLANLMDAAEAAMRQAKEAGRNCVRVCPLPAA